MFSRYMWDNNVYFKAAARSMIIAVKRFFNSGGNNELSHVESHFGTSATRFLMYRYQFAKAMSV